jgi:hypothetical protein
MLCSRCVFILVLLIGCFLSLSGQKVWSLDMAELRQVAQDPHTLGVFLGKAEHGDACVQYDLGAMYLNGIGVPEDDAKAFQWAQKAADQGLPGAEWLVGSMYAMAQGVPRDDYAALKWYTRSAMAGDPEAASSLGQIYDNGTPLDEPPPPNRVESLAWLDVAIAAGYSPATYWRLAVLGDAESAGEDVERLKEEAARRCAELSRLIWGHPHASGSGVVVGGGGLVLTAAHVVEGASVVKVFTQDGFLSAKVVAVDSEKDVAVLRCPVGSRPVPVAPSDGVRLGQPVFTIGFPHIDFQGLSPKLTTGEISSAEGMQDDPDQWQVSVPVQSGNSGGPLFDESGNVIGIIDAKLDAGTVAAATGDVPQNVNYAVKSACALPLLAPFKVELPPLSGPSQEKLEDVVARVRGAVVLIVVY